MEKKSFIKSKYGSIPLIIHRDSKRDKGVVILCHGLKTWKNSNTGLALTKAFAKAGISTIRFDFYGHGESKSKLENLTLTKAINNLSTVIRYAQKLGFGKVGLFGSSFGGAVALQIVVKRNSRINFIALKAPASDFTTLLRNEFRNYLSQWRRKGVLEKNLFFGIKYSFYKDLQQYKFYSVYKKITAPTLIFHGNKDRSVPLIYSKKLLQSLKIDNKQLIVFKGCDHHIQQPKHFNKLVSTTVAWGKQYL